MILLEQRHQSVLLVTRDQVLFESGEFGYVLQLLVYDKITYVASLLTAVQNKVTQHLSDGVVGTRK